MGACSQSSLSIGKFSKSSKSNTNYQRRNMVQVAIKMKLVLYLALIILLACEHAKPTFAILNCFTPNMFKMNKGYANAERANWYPHQSQLPPASGYPTAGGYFSQLGGYSGHNPMKYLFQPKWKSGGLFGGKGWNNWKMGSTNNFYRPNGYGGSYTGSMILPPVSSYPYSIDQLTMSPHAMQYAIGSSYSGSSQISSNDGWSAPVSLAHQQQATPAIQQTLIGNYDSYTQMPLKQQLATDNYGTKGGSGTTGRYTTTSTTTKNALLANNVYGYHDELSKPSYGYTYPQWYSGVVDSPAKVAQQLLKYGLKKQQNRSAPLIDSSMNSSPDQFIILDEPRFVGFGSINLLNNKEARLGCSFSEAIDQSNRPLWVKFLGPYNSSQITNGKRIPPFNCANSQCRTQEIESTKDYRYKFDNGPATSTLIIAEPRLSDYGIYRCSALTKAINNNPLETVYQIVQLDYTDCYSDLN